jgi:hypothetical protein
MNLVAALLAPFMLLMPEAGTVEATRDITGPSNDLEPREQIEDEAWFMPDQAPVAESKSWPLQVRSGGPVPESAWQVRIERRMTIRITPLSPQPRRTDMLFGVPNRAIGPRFEERRMGKCLSVSAISGVQPNGGNRLLLFMRDERIVSAELERACRARDFYSGFYLSQNNDGKLCVGRDQLQSRSGVNCKLSSLRRLVESDD